MVDGNGFDPDKAYKDSKLCNVFFTKELQARLNAKEDCAIKAYCFNPGLIVGTGMLLVFDVIKSINAHNLYLFLNIFL